MKKLSSDGQFTARCPRCLTSYMRTQSHRCIPMKIATDSYHRDARERKEAIRLRKQSERWASSVFWGFVIGVPVSVVLALWWLTR